THRRRALLARRGARIPVLLRVRGARCEGRCADTDGGTERAAHERATVQLVSIFGHDSLPRHIEMLEPDTINLRGIWGKPRTRRRYPEAERTPPRRSVGLSAQVVPETLDLAPERLVRQA